MRFLRPPAGFRARGGTLFFGRRGPSCSSTGIGHTWRGWKPMLPLLERDFDVRIALELARRGRATSVVAISPAGLQHKREKGWGRSILLGMRWAARNLPAPGALLRSPLGPILFAGPVVARPWRLDPDDFAEVLRLFAEAPGFLDTLPHTFGGQPKGLNQIGVPVTILWGTRDLLLLPRQAKRFERLIPNAELRYLDGLGHAPMSDDPELLAELIATTSRGRRAAARA